MWRVYVQAAGTAEKPALFLVIKVILRTNSITDKKQPLGLILFKQWTEAIQPVIEHFDQLLMLISRG